MIEIREQKREKERDSKRQIKNGERERKGGKESGRFMGAERMRLLKRGMKWYCSLFPFGSFCVFVKLCQIAEPKPCAVGANLCVFVCGEDGKREREGEKVYAKM